MANWTQDPPEKPGFYWFASGKGDGRTECPAELHIRHDGTRMWAVPFGYGGGYEEGSWSRKSNTQFGPAIPSPDELEAMPSPEEWESAKEYIAASEAFMANDCPPYGSRNHREMTLRWDAARSALKKIREGKP